MKILLVALTKDFLRAERVNKPKGTIFLRFPSLALANLAALTPKEYEIEVVDEQISPVEFKKYDLVAISVNTSIVPRAYEIADKFRKRGVKVVFGGLHPSLMPDESLKHADSIIVGDAERSWQTMLSDLSNGKLKKKYVSDQTKPLELPIPNYDIFKGMGYVTTNFVETSRGCSYHCDFCSTSPFYHHKHRTRPIKDVIRDIKNVKSFPKQFIFFVDDNIIGDKAYAKKLFKALKPLNIYWISQATVDIGEDEELVRLAAKSGCFGLFIGFESISEENLKDMHKKHNHVNRYNRTVELLHKHGVGLEAAFVFGFDKDDKTVFKETLNFLNKAKVDSFLAIYLTPIPGTIMYKHLENRLVTDDYSKFDFRHLVFEPKKMSSKDLYDGVSWISMNFYSRKLVAKRFMWKLLQFIKRPSIRRLLGVVGILGISIGFRSRIKDLSKDGTFPKI